METGFAVEISRTKRHLPPAHYSLKVDKWSLLSAAKKYESGVFEAGGYKWRMIFYPKGDKDNGGENFISLYLAIAETESLPVRWEVNANFKMFVHDQLNDKYLTIQEPLGVVKRFHGIKTTWGFAQLLDLLTFKDSLNGYLVKDSCVFGVEVFVIKHSGNWESVSLSEADLISNNTFTWEIENFSELDKDIDQHSEVFIVQGRNWNLQICPNGDRGDKGKTLSFYLMPSHWSASHISKAGVYARCKLRVVDQVNGKHAVREVANHFTAFELGWGHHDFISLEELHKPARGFIVKDKLKVQVEFVEITETTYHTQTSN